MSLTHLDDGRLALLDELGRGGMASVRRARCARTGKLRAAKILAPHLAQRKALRDRFLREARVMQSLEHPNICRVYRAGFEGPLPWIEMELVGGRSLQDWMRTHKRPMPPRMAVDAVLQVADALAYAHGQGVVHRDIKPENLLVAPDGRVVVVDFGIARLLDGASHTRTGVAMGSYGFMAPEQMEDAKRVDARADVYSLALTLGCLLSFVDARRKELLFERVSELAPPELAVAIVRASTTEPAHRTESMERFARHLRRGVEGLTDERQAPPLHLPN